MSWLLIPTILYVLTFAFAIIDIWIEHTWEKTAFLLTERLLLLLLKLPPLIIAVLVSSRSGKLDSIVSKTGWEKISLYLAKEPAKWMFSLTTAVDSNLLIQLAAITGLLGAVTYFVEINQQALVQPWDSRYERFGSCTDGVKSGLEQHIDCGGPESGCPQTCKEKYGEYILIPGTRKCTEVDGYMSITTQRACTVAYNSWAHANDMKAGPLTRVYLDYSWDRDRERYFKQPPRIDNWTNTFSCGALSMPPMVGAITGTVFGIPLEMANDDRVAFPALFPSDHRGLYSMHRYSELPIAHLCYAGTGCQATSKEVDDTRFYKNMPCPGTSSSSYHGIRLSSYHAIPLSSGQDNRLASAWRNISTPFPIVKFGTKTSQNSDCAEIQVDNSKHVGAQAVFKLACDARLHTDYGHTSGTNGTLACPDRVQVRVKSGQFIRAALLVFPTADMTYGMRFKLNKLEQRTIEEVYPDSTFVLVVDQRSDKELMIELCF